MSGLIAILRVRGSIRVDVKARETLEMLNLHRVNHLVLVKNSPENLGMIYAAKDYITWGLVNESDVEAILSKRGLLEGNVKINEQFLKSNKLDIKGLAVKLMQDPKSVYALGVKRVFRLSPPLKGYGRKGIRMLYSKGGVLGDRKDKIMELLSRMM